MSEKKDYILSLEVGEIVPKSPCPCPKKLTAGCPYGDSRILVVSVDIYK